MSSVLFLVLFVFPGILYRLMLKRCVPKPKGTESTYEELVKVFVFSMFVLMANLFIFNAYTLNALTALSRISNNSVERNDLLCIFVYFGVTLLTTFIIAVTWYFVLRKELFKFWNFFREKNGLPKEIEQKTVWDKITEKKGFAERSKVVSIIRNGEIVLSGCMTEWFNSAMTWRDMKLENVEDVTCMLKDKPELFEAEYDCYFSSDNFSIRFYNDDRYYEELEQRIKDWEATKGE